MNSRKQASLSAPLVRDFFDRARESLGLKPLLGEVGFQNRIEADASGKLCANIQVWGRRDCEALGLLAAEVKKARIYERLKRKVAALIFAEGSEVPAEALDLARRFQVAVFGTKSGKKQVVAALRRILTGYFPQKIIISGGLLEITGLGVLIMGDSGVGKSESALELIARGHRFVSDDVTQVRKTEEGRILGSAPPLSQNFMEIRGLSIININRIFGPQVITPQAEIDLVIYLERWEAGKEYDRLGLDKPEKIDILGVEIPQITVPVAPGRNIATLIEVACKVHILRNKGYHAPREMTERLDQVLDSE